MNRQIIEKNNYNDEYWYFRIPGIVVTANNSILTYYECRASESDWANIDIAMKKSCDDGQTWTQRKILVYGNEKTVNNPVMFADEKKILLMWQEEYKRTFCMESFDDGDTWERPYEITSFTEKIKPFYDWTVIACGPGHGTVLDTGRYIVPVWFCSNHKDSKAHRPSVISVLYSDDCGKSWEVGELLDTDYIVNPNETALAKLADGSILLNIRHETEKHKRVLAHSKSGVDNWYNIHFVEELPDPICEGSMVSDGSTVFFVNCQDENDRINLTLSKSENNCHTWHKQQLIDSDGGYSDIAVSNDSRHLYILYEGGRIQIKDGNRMEALKLAIIENPNQ